MDEHRPHDARAGKVLFHVALAAGAVPLLGLPVVVLAALSARSEASEERGRRWARRITVVLAIDVVTSLVVGLTIAGLLPAATALAPPERPARIGIVADEDDAGLGVRVGSVLEGGPADEAGIVARDVIISVGSVAVDDADELRRAIESAPSPVSVEVRRGDVLRTIEVVPAGADDSFGDACAELEPSIPQPRAGTLLTYGVFLLGTALLALIGWRRGVRGGARVWPAFVTIPALGALAGAATAMLACRVGAEDLVLESALVGSEVVLVVLGGLAVWAVSRVDRGPEVLLEGEAPLSTSRTVLAGAFYVATWVPRVLVLATPLMFLAREHGLEGASDALGAVLGGDRTPLALAITFLAGAVLAPIGEELIFRGLLLPHLARIVAPWTAIAISALLFGALHEAHGVARVGPMAIGAILGWARLRSGTLRAPIAIHMIVNATALSVAWLAE